MAKATSTALHNVEIGLSTEARGQMTTLLNSRLADLLVFYMKLRNYHWNVTGQHFGFLHALFEQQYDIVAEEIDEFAERVRMLGGVSLGTLREALENATAVKEAPGELPDDRGMIANLAADHEAIVRGLREDAEAADEAGDSGTNDFLIGIMRAHEKMAWFLRARLDA